MTLEPHDHETRNLLESILCVYAKVEHFKFVTCFLDPKKTLNFIFESINFWTQHVIPIPFPLWSPLGLDSPQPSLRHLNRPQHRTKEFAQRSLGPGIWLDGFNTNHVRLSMCLPLMDKLGLKRGNNQMFIPWNGAGFWKISTTCHIFWTKEHELNLQMHINSITLYRFVDMYACTYIFSQELECVPNDGPFIENKERITVFQHSNTLNRPFQPHFECFLMQPPNVFFWFCAHNISKCLASVSTCLDKNLCYLFLICVTYVKFQTKSKTSFCYQPQICSNFLKSCQPNPQDPVRWVWIKLFACYFHPYPTQMQKS